MVSRVWHSPAAPSAIPDLKTPGPWSLFRLTVVPNGSFFPVLPVFQQTGDEVAKAASSLRPLAKRAGDSEDYPWITIECVAGS